MRLEVGLRQVWNKYWRQTAAETGCGCSNKRDAADFRVDVPFKFHHSKAQLVQE